MRTKRSSAVVVLLLAGLLAACSIGGEPPEPIAVTENPDSTPAAPQAIPLESTVTGFMGGTGTPPPPQDPNDITDRYALTFSGARVVRVSCTVTGINEPSVIIAAADGSTIVNDGQCDGSLITGESTDGAFIDLSIGTGAVLADYTLLVSVG